MIRSWPFCADASAAARAGISFSEMWSTMTLVLFFWPHCGQNTPSNHLSYSGTKWLHWRIFRVFCCAAARSGKRKKGPTPAAPAANVPAPVSLMKSRRVSPRPFFLAMSSFLLLRIFKPCPGHASSSRRNPESSRPGRWGRLPWTQPSPGKIRRQRALSLLLLPELGQPRENLLNREQHLVPAEESKIGFLAYPFGNVRAKLAQKAELIVELVRDQALVLPIVIAHNVVRGRHRQDVNAPSIFEVQTHVEEQFLQRVIHSLDGQHLRAAAQRTIAALHQGTASQLGHDAPHASAAAARDHRNTPFPPIAPQGFASPPLKDPRDIARGHAGASRKKLPRRSTQPCAPAFRQGSGIRCRTRGRPPAGRPRRRSGRRSVRQAAPARQWAGYLRSPARAGPAAPQANRPHRRPPRSGRRHPKGRSGSPSRRGLATPPRVPYPSAASRRGRLNTRCTPIVPYATPSRLGAINGAELTSSQPSAPAPLIHVSKPLTIPSGVSEKRTIRSKYSHCIVCSSPSSPAAEVARLCPSRGQCQMVGQPTGNGFEHQGVKLEFAVIEPARQVANQTVFVLYVRPQIGGNIPQLRPRQYGFQSRCAFQHRGDIALRVQQQARAVVAVNGAKGLEQFHDVTGVRLAHTRTGEILKHPFALRRDLRHHRRGDRHHTIGRGHQRQPPAQTDADRGGAPEATKIAQARFQLVAHAHADGCFVLPLPAQINRQRGHSLFRDHRGQRQHLLLRAAIAGAEHGPAARPIRQENKGRDDVAVRGKKVRHALQADRPAHQSSSRKAPPPRRQIKARRLATKPGYARSKPPRGF